VGRVTASETKAPWPAQRKLAFEVANTTHHRFSLGLENIRGSFDAVVLNIFISVPQTTTPRDHLKVRAGSIALYGLRRASMPERTGLGLTFILISREWSLSCSHRS
jgi:hypothetical protein